MNLRRLWPAVQALLAAETPQARQEVLRQYPILLDKKTVEQLRREARKLRAGGNAEKAQLYEGTAEATERMRRAAWEGKQASARARWAALARRHLAEGDGDLLEQALTEAARSAGADVVAFLRAFQSGDLPEVARLSGNLVPALSEAGRQEEAQSAILLGLSCTARLAESYRDFSHFRQAEVLGRASEACEMGASLAQKLGELPCEAWFRAAAGFAFRHAGKAEEAASACWQAAALYRPLAKDRPSTFGPCLARTLHRLADVLAALRRPEEEEPALREAIDLYRRPAQDRPGDFTTRSLAAALNHLGSLLSKLGRLCEAEEPYRESVALCRQLAASGTLTDELNLAAALNDLGITLRDLHRLEKGKAADRLEEAEALLREGLVVRRKLAQERPGDLATALSNLGIVLTELRRPDEAEAAYQEALDIRRRLAEDEPSVHGREVAVTLNNLGALLWDRRPKDAEHAYREALEWFERHDLPDERRIALANLGRQLFDHGRHEEALEVLRQAVQEAEHLRAEALTLDQRLRVLRENAETYERLLVCLMRLGRHREALEAAERGKGRTLIDLLTLRDLRPRNAPPEVAQEYEQTLLRARVLEEELRQANGDGPFTEGPEGRRLRREELDEAAGRVREMTEIIRNAPPETARAFEEVLQRARELEGVLKQARDDGGITEGPESPRQQREELNQATRRLRELTEVIRRHDPDFLPYARPLSADEIVALAADIGATLVLLRVTREGTFIFLVFPDGATDVVTVPDFTARSLVESMVSLDDERSEDGWLMRYYACQAAREEETAGADSGARERWMEAMDEALRGLYERLLRPVHDALRRRGGGTGGRPPSVVLVPDRAMAILPLHACWWNEGPARRCLLDEYVIRYAPSLSILERCLEHERSGRGRETLLGVANPVPPGNLTFSEWECEEIEKRLGSRCLMLWREQATKAEVRRRMGERHLLHFSCHGRYRYDAPLESAVFLAAGERLTLGEILEEVHLPQAWLVVLSACETGLVDFREIADEHYGLPAGFLYAGAPTVYGSLWTVNDLSTALLMVKVYEGLLNEAKTKPEALRDAQLWLRDLTAQEVLTLLRDKEAELRQRMAWSDIAPIRRRLQFTHQADDRPFAHPYWWAAFQCVGV